MSSAPIASFPWRSSFSGSGAREHTLLLARSRYPCVEALICPPGNAGTAHVADNRSVQLTDGAAVVALAQEGAIDLVVIGPDVPRPAR